MTVVFSKNWHLSFCLAKFIYETTESRLRGSLKLLEDMSKGQRYKLSHIIVVNIVLLAIASVLVALRLVSRWLSAAHFWWDDGFIVLSLVCSIAAIQHLPESHQHSDPLIRFYHLECYWYVPFAPKGTCPNFQLTGHIQQVQTMAQERIYRVSLLSRELHLRK